MTEKYENCKHRIEFLLEKLPYLDLEDSWDRQYIGEAVSYLRLFLDTLESGNQNEKITTD